MLHPKTIARIRELLAEGQPPAVVAKTFKVLPSIIRKIAEAGEAALEPRPAAGDPGAHVGSSEAAGEDSPQRAPRGVGSVAPQKVAKVRKLLAQGRNNVPYSTIARQTGLARATVAAIARMPAVQPAAFFGKRREELPDWTGEIGTCPHCGARNVELPCLLCLLRANPLPRVLAGIPDASLALDLHGTVLKRYCILHAKKLAEGEASDAPAAIAAALGTTPGRQVSEVQPTHDRAS